MKTYRLQREIQVPRSLPEVFEFFAHPENLAKLTPDSLRFRILTPGPIEMRQGALIDYVIHVWGWPVRWTTVIADWRPCDLFVDVQLRGPYSFWHHTHRFSESGAGTLIEDDVRYALPLGPLGAVAHALLVRRQLTAIFDHRAAAILHLMA